MSGAGSLLAAIVPERFEWLEASRYSFSLGVEAAGVSWLAGHTSSAFDPATGRVGVAGDGGAQAEVCWAKVGRVLEAAGRTPADVTELVEYVTVDGLAQLDRIRAARPAGLRADLGSVAVVESLVRPTAVLEVEVVAGGPPDLVRLPQILPVDADGRVVAPGEFVGQCRWVLEEAGRRLADHGLGLEHVVRTVQHSTPATRADYGATAADRRRLLGPLFPASTGVLTPALPHPGALVALDVWATRSPKRAVVHRPEAYAPLTFGPAVAAGGLLFISGTTAWDPETGGTVGGDDIAAQAAFVYGEIAAVCAAAGTSIDRLVKTIEYVTPAGVARYREVGAVREQILGRPLPASTGVVVSALLGRQWQIEIEAVAVL